MSDRYSLGVDYGTNSVRALVVNVATGEELAAAVYDYQRGDAGILLDSRDPNLARQSPADYIDGFYASTGAAIKQARSVAGFDPQRIVGVGVDTTGSTPLPVDAAGVPLALLDEFQNDLAAQAWLWKDHTSYAEAAEISAAATREGRPYLAKCGGTYSSEWYWAKLLHILKVDESVRNACYSWVEHCDWIPYLLTGGADVISG